jgi:protease-4
VRPLPFPLEVARRAGANLAHAARRAAARALLPRRQGFWIEIALAPPLGDLPPPRWPFAREPAATLLELLETLEAAGSDPQVDGVLLRFAGAPGGLAQALSLRRAVVRLRERGKPVAAFGERLGVPELLVASAAQRLWLPETGSLHLVGLRLEGTYLRGLLGKLRVEPDVIRIGSHKSAGERLTRESMSPEEREQLEALADDLYATLVDALAEGRGLPPEAVRARVDAGPYHGRSAVAAGLADACLYPDELEGVLEELTPIPPPERAGPRRVVRVRGSVYHALRAGDPGWRPLWRGLPRVAYVVARGAIHGGRGGRGIASDELGELLEALGRDEGVRGVVLRLESAGGDALASDLLWRSVVRVTREKPVVVSMGEVAASGGYYLAAGADALLAEAATLTGSIGVVGGKLNLEGLYQRLGVGKDAVERGARAGLLSEARGFTPGERSALRREMAALYAAFLDRVARRRGVGAEAIEPLAGGRVWSGVRALSHGLVDALGGPLEALALARRRAGLAPGERVLVEVYPRASRRVGLAWWLRGLPGFWDAHR